MPSDSNEQPGDRRTNQRHPVTQEAMVSQGPHFRLCNIRDMSLNGVFLELGWGVLTRNTPVEVTLSLNNTAKAPIYRLSGEVARVSKEGTAVKFHPIDDKTLQDLSGLLRTS